jgi:hypothetical protein
MVQSGAESAADTTAVRAASRRTEGRIARRRMAVRIRLRAPADTVVAVDTPPVAATLVAEAAVIPAVEDIPAEAIAKNKLQ